MEASRCTDTVADDATSEGHRLFSRAPRSARVCSVARHNLARQVTLLALCPSCPRCIQHQTGCGRKRAADYAVQLSINAHECMSCCVKLLILWTAGLRWRGSADAVAGAYMMWLRCKGRLRTRHVLAVANEA
eukprot:1884488-Amphidinium_carterae.1